MIKVLGMESKKNVVTMEKDGELFRVTILNDDQVTMIERAVNYNGSDKNLKWIKLSTVSIKKVFGISKSVLLHDLGLGRYRDTISLG